MPNDDERREVAAELRKLAAEADEEGEFCDGGEVEFTLDLVIDANKWCYTPASIRYLADLIEPEERTCKIKRELHKGYPTTYGICSRCNALVNAESAVSNATDYLPTRYCPSCGARVVSDSD